MLVAAAHIKCQGASDPVSTTRLSLALPYPCSFHVYSDTFLPVACAERFSNAKEWAARMPFTYWECGSCRQLTVR